MFTLTNKQTVFLPVWMRMKMIRCGLQPLQQVGNMLQKCIFPRILKLSKQMHTAVHSYPIRTQTSPSTRLTEEITNRFSKILFSCHHDRNPLKHPSRSMHISPRYYGVMEDRNTKDLTVWSDIKQVTSSPVPALVLGLSGLVPFVAAPGFMMINQAFLSELAFAQVAYGASILSFLGGIRWGFTLPEENPIKPDWINLGYSVTPSLVAWGGLLLPYPFSLFTMMGGLTLAGYFDLAMFGYPPWFKGLRFILSFVAVLSLWTTFMCGFLLTDNSKKQKK